MTGRCSCCTAGTVRAGCRPRSSCMQAAGRGGRSTGFSHSHAHRHLHAVQGSSWVVDRNERQVRGILRAQTRCGELALRYADTVGSPEEPGWTGDASGWSKERVEVRTAD